MPSMNTVQPAASSFIPAKVAGRTLLNEGSIVAMAIPATATEGQIPDGSVRYLQFSHPVKGGTVNVFVHFADDAERDRIRGTRVTREAKIWSKTLKSGCVYLHIDLHPAPQGTPVTHRLCVVTNVLELVAASEFRVFKTPAPLGGAIVLTAPEAKVELVRMKPVVKALVESPAVPSTGDAMLDRLLADGWKIQSEAGSCCMLSKTKDGKTKVMKHFRARPKSKKK